MIVLNSTSFEVFHVGGTDSGDASKDFWIASLQMLLVCGVRKTKLLLNDMN